MPIDLNTLVSDSPILNLEGKNIGDEGAKALATNTNLTTLYLRENRISDEGAKALATNTSLTALDLKKNWIGDEGVKALAANTNLALLELSFNEVGDEGAKALAANTNLIALNLWLTQIGNEGAKALAQNTNLTSLNLGANHIGNEGAIALAANTNLTSLNLAANQIGDEGAIEFAANTNLTTLDLSHNNIGDEGAKALATNMNLDELYLEKNPIGNEGILALEKAAKTNPNLINIKVEFDQADLDQLVLINLGRAQKAAQNLIKENYTTGFHCYLEKAKPVITHILNREHKKSPKEIKQLFRDARRHYENNWSALAGITKETFGTLPSELTAEIGKYLAPSDIKRPPSQQPNTITNAPSRKRAHDELLDRG